MKITSENGTVKIKIEKDKLDMKNAEQLDQQAADYLQADTKLVVIDLENVKLVDSSGVGKILKLQSELKEIEAKLKLTNVNDQYVQKLVNLVHLDELMEIEKA